MASPSRQLLNPGDMGPREPLMPALVLLKMSVRSAFKPFTSSHPRAPLSGEPT